MSKRSTVYAFMKSLILLALMFNVSSVAFAKAGFNCGNIFSKSQAVKVDTHVGPIWINEPAALLLWQDQQLLKKAFEARGEERKRLLNEYYRPANSITQLSLTIVNYGLALGMAVKLAVEFYFHPEAITMTLAYFPPTLFLTAFVADLFHKVVDTFLSETNPIWGPAARANRVHHEFPGNLNNLTYMKNIAPFAPLVFPLYALASAASMHTSPELTASMLTMLLLFSNGSEIHRQAHLNKPATWAMVGQWTTLLLNHKDHMAHHYEPIDKNYGIVNSYTHPITNPLWLRVDQALWKALRRMPNNWIQQPESIPNDVIRDLIADIARLPQALIVSNANRNAPDPRVDALLPLWLERFPERRAGETP